MAPSRPFSDTKPIFKQTTLNKTFFKHQTPDTPRPSSSVSGQGGSRFPPVNPSSSSGSDRVLTDVLLAIQPVHLANIANRQKNHEYRKYRLADGVERLWLHETRGSNGIQGKGRAAITHIATVPPNVRRTPGTVPEEPPGIGNADFNAGLKESKYGYPILKLFELIRPVTLDEMIQKWELGGAPMGWRYLRAAMWRDRWGEDEASRVGKLKRIF